MPPIQIVNDQPNLVSTSEYPYAKFYFDKFNSVQSRVLEYYNKDINLIVSAPTGSGKTECAEILASYEVRVNKKKAMYLVPYKSLAQEKYDDWTNSSHHFSDLKIAVCTGDYKLTADRKKELDEANIIIMSSEMLNSRSRNNKSERNKFLQDLGVLISDEFHLVGDSSRGHHLEAGIMKFTEINNSCKLVLLSATLPNVAEIAEWASYTLNKKETVLIKSKYRACPLNIHYERYDDSESYYDEKEKQKVITALDIVDYYPEDKFLIFAHTKKTGNLMKEYLADVGITAEFHNADLTKDKRVKIEKEFKTGKLRVIIATSTVAAGVNLPARRVIILGVHRGVEEVSALDIIQECGRSGRPKYDPCGDAYVLLPDRDYDLQKARIKTLPKIASQMLDDVGGMHKNLCFHLVSEINQEIIKDREDVKHWYQRSLACFQSYEMDDIIVNNTIDLLKKLNIIWEEDGKITVTSIGKIASLFYYSPFDVANLKRNFDNIFDNDNENNDYLVSFALGNIDTHKMGIASKLEKEQMIKYLSKINEIYGADNVKDSAAKAGYAYYCLLNGVHNDVLSGFIRQLQFDFPRSNQVLQALDGFCGKWNKKDWLNQLNLRIAYGVKAEYVDLCKLPNIGKVRSEKLFKAGIKTARDILDNVPKAKKVLGFKDEIMNEILTEAKKISLTE